MTMTDTPITTNVDPVVTMTPVTNQDTSSQLTTGELHGQSQNGQIQMGNAQIDSSVAPIALSISPVISKGMTTQKDTTAAADLKPYAIMAVGLGVCAFALWKYRRRYYYGY